MSLFFKLQQRYHIFINKYSLSLSLSLSHTCTHTHTPPPPPPPQPSHELFITWHLLTTTTTKEMDENKGRYKAEQVAKLEINVQTEEGYRSKQKG